MLKFKDFYNYVASEIKKTRKSRYFYPVIITIGFCLVTFVILYVGSTPTFSQLKENDVSPRTVYAPYDFTYPTTIDEEKTESVRAEFEAKVLPVYDIDASVQKKAFTKLDNFFSIIGKTRQISDIDDEQRIKTVREKTGLELSDKDISSFIKSKDLEKIQKISKDTLENIFLVGIVAAQNKEKLLSQDREEILVRNLSFEIERKPKTIDLIDENEAKKVARNTLERAISKDRFTRKAIYELIKAEIIPNAQFNEKETSRRKEEVRKDVPPVYKRKAIKKNELIVEKGQRLTANDITKLTQITRISAVVNRTSYLSGLFILLAGLVLITAIYLRLLEKNTIQVPKNIALISINAFLAIFVTLVLVRYQQSGYIIPLASMAMILMLLLNVNSAFIVSLALSIYIGFLAGGKLGLSFVLFLGSVLGIYAVRGARRRSQIFVAGFTVALANFIFISGIGLLNNSAKDIILRDGLYGLANGIISAFIVIGLLPFFEYAFNLITNITLLELSDLSNPLLKELTVKAPGTYHHSTLVGNLAEEACDAIGANSLLARVGAYYHDIGKIEKAEYFVENEMGIPSRHKKLTPSMSALIITNHTRDGVELGKKYKLNSAIMDFINQHHGTSLIYYFYQRALEKVSSGEDLKEEEFRYPGPKPQTKETAIVLLADSVEASSRMLSDPTPSRIRNLVQKIINNKFIDGQLDECDLTLQDLNRIAESFVRVLTGVFHTRLEYPEVKSKKAKKNDVKNKNK